MKKNESKLILLTFLFLIPFVISSCTSSPHPRERGVNPKSYLFLNSVLNVKILDKNADKEKIMKRVKSRLEEIEEKMSLNLPTSELNKINENAGIKPVKVSDDTLSLIKTSLKYHKLSADNQNGAFDIRIGPLVKLWDIGGLNQKIPSYEEIISVLNKMKGEVIIKENTVYLEDEGMILDLGGAAKGYATDEIVKILREEGVKSAIIDLGGNIYILGSKEDGSDFKVGIQDPTATRGHYLGTVSLSDKSVVTSGTYERYFEDKGIRYHHILSTTTGYPADNNLVSVSVIGENSTLCDIMSTTLYLLGLEKGLEVAEKKDGLEAIFLTKTGDLYLTQGANSIFTLTETGFNIAN